jgi:spoIIIJ-associated protein
MSDRVFSGRDVAEALGTAAQALGLPPARLRYVVLDAGSEGGLGLKPTPARVAVLLGAASGVASAGGPSRSAASLPAVPPPAVAPIERREEAGDVALEVEKIVAALAGTAKVDVQARVMISADAFLIVLTGSGVASFLLGPAEATVGDALEHLLQGMFAQRVAPRRFRVEFQGQRQQREEGLRARALELVAAVLLDGQPRTTDPLNAYERRLVHMAVAERPGVITYSVGGGADRRVTIAPTKASLGGEVH